MTLVAQKTVLDDFDYLNKIAYAAQQFVNLVKSQHPGEELYVPELRALDEALTEWSNK